MSEEKFETVIFGNKTFGKLLEEVHTNSKNTDALLFGMVQDMKELIETLGDAITLAPIIATYVKMAIDNNEHIIKIAGIVQKSLDKAKEKGGDDTEVMFTEEEKAALAEAMQEWEGNLKLPGNAGRAPSQIQEVPKTLPDSSGVTIVPGVPRRAGRPKKSEVNV